MHPENPEGTQVIVGSMNMGFNTYIILISHIRLWIYYHHHHHPHQLNVHFLPRSIKGLDGCFPTALGRQSTILKAAVYPWESWSWIYIHTILYTVPHILCIDCYYKMKHICTYLVLHKHTMHKQHNQHM